MGHRSTRTSIQADDLDADTRTALWNVLNTLRTVLDDVSRRTISKTPDQLLAAVWAREFKRAADEQPSDSRLWGEIKTRVLAGEWFDVLDLLERIVGYLKVYEDSQTKPLVKAIKEAFNTQFEHYLVGYRFIGVEITPLDDTTQSKAVSEAVGDAGSIKGARHHLERAIELLSDRTNPDYPNSIKESISAVEAVCVAITGEKTLGAAVKKLGAAGVAIHPSLETAWSKMYGWTSDANGIRHGSIDRPDTNQELAKYVLVTCSAFVSLLIETARKSKII